MNSNSFRSSDSVSRDSRIELVGQEVKSLISDATKRSFLEPQNAVTQSVNGIENFDPSSTSANVLNKHLLPRRHFVDYSNNKDQFTNSKWNIANENLHYSPSDVTVTSSRQSSLLSKVTIDDDMETSASRSTWLGIADSSDFTFDDHSNEQQNWNYNGNHTHSYQKIAEKDQENVTFAGCDPAARGDMSYSTTPSIKTNSSTDSDYMLSKPPPSSSYSNASVQSSYTVNKPTFSSLDSARAAGYPVITKSVGFNPGKVAVEMTHSRCADVSEFGNHFNNNVGTYSHNPQTQLASFNTQKSTPGDTDLVDNQNAKYVQWTDLHSRFSDKNNINNPAVQVTDRFNRLVHELEVVQLESVQHNALHHLDIAKAILLLKKAKQDLQNVESGDMSNTAEGQDNYKPAEPYNTVEEPNVQDLRESQNAVLMKATNKSFTSSAVSQAVMNTNNVTSSMTEQKHKHTLTESKVTFQPISPKNVKQKLSTNTALHIPPTPDEKDSTPNPIPEHPPKGMITVGETSSRRNLFPFKVNGRSVNSQHDESVSYDSFSANVQASSCHSTPSKSPLTVPAVNENISSADMANATGFLILDEKTPPGKIAKKKEQFLLGRLKKEEEHRRNQMEREMDAENRKQKAKEQQELLTQKKQEEKEKRDKIFKDYQKRKRKEEKAAQQNHGIIASCTPTNSGKKTPKSNSHLADRLHTFSHSDAVDMSSTVTVPVSSRSNYATPVHHHLVNEEDTDSLGSGGSSEYTGPKLYKQLQSKSNRTLITNAINHCCLSGKVNEKTRDKTIKALEASEARHLMVLFRDKNCQFRALYGYHPDGEKLHKICGNGPSSIVPSMIEALFKYNSGRRAFTCVPSKTLSVSIDGITIRNSLWQHAHTKK